MQRRILRFACSLPTTLLLVLSACNDSTGPQPVTSVSVNPTTADVDEGETLQLVAVVRAADGTALSNQTISWLLGDTTVASVSETGLLTGIRDGQTTLNVSSGGHSALVPVTVTGRAATIVLASTRTSLDEVETAVLSAVVTSHRGTTLARRPLSWSSSDTLIARVVTTGANTAQATGAGHGSASISATLDGVIASLTLSVRGTVARIQLSRSRLDFVSGQATAITAQTWSSNNVLLTDRVVTSSNNAPNVASVTGAFTVNAIAPGSATITIRSEGQSADLTVVVHRILLGEIGWSHTCAIVEDVSTYCWGNNQLGELGIGSREPKRTPERVDTPAQFVSLIGLAGATIGRTATGAYYTWGGSYGTSSDVPIPSLELSGLTGVVGGANFICGLAPDARAYCWGNNQSGQLGTGSLTPIFTSRPGVPVVGPALSALFTSSTAQHTCGIETTGAAWCWGSNAVGELGDLTKTVRAAPVAVSGGFTYSLLATGTFFTCGKTTTAELRCWGAGDGIWLPSSVAPPQLISAGINFVRLTAGIWHACGLTSAGDAYCWGTTLRGALGNGTVIPAATPVPVAGGRKWVAIAAGGDRTCGVADTWRMYCWGTNENGELGNGSLAYALVPVEVTWPALPSPGG